MNKPMEWIPLSYQGFPPVFFSKELIQSLTSFPTEKWFMWGGRSECVIGFPLAKLLTPEEAGEQLYKLRRTSQDPPFSRYTTRVADFTIGHMNERPELLSAF